MLYVFNIFYVGLFRGCAGASETKGVCPLCRCIRVFRGYKALCREMGMVRSVDVARHMDVSKPSVCHAVAVLQEGGFLAVDGDHFLHLTEQGRIIAEKIYERHRFFTDRLIEAGVDPKTAEADACRIEHVISDETFRRLKEKYQSKNENRGP